MEVFRVICTFLTLRAAIQQVEIAVSVHYVILLVGVAVTETMFTLAFSIVTVCLVELDLFR